MLAAPNFFVHYFHTTFLHLHQNIFKRILKFKKRNGYFFLIMVIYYYQNFGKGDEDGIGRGCKNSRIYLYNK